MQGVGCAVRQMTMQVLTATQTTYGATPLPRLVTGIDAGSLPGVNPGHRQPEKGKGPALWQRVPGHPGLQTVGLPSAP